MKTESNTAVLPAAVFSAAGLRVRSNLKAGGFDCTPPKCRCIEANAWRKCMGWDDETPIIPG